MCGYEQIRFVRIGKEQYEIEFSSSAKHCGIRNYVDNICVQLQMFPQLKEGISKIRLMGYDLKINVDPKNQVLEITKMKDEGFYKNVEASIFNYYQMQLA